MISFSQVSSMAALLIRYAHKQSAKYSSMYFNFVICSIIFFSQGRVAVIIFQKYKTLSTWNNYFIVENPSRVHTNIFQNFWYFFSFLSIALKLWKSCFTRSFHTKKIINVFSFLKFWQNKFLYIFCGKLGRVYAYFFVYDNLGGEPKK